LGEAGGAKTHTLTTAEMPSHTHVQNAHAHTFANDFFNHAASAFGINGQVYKAQTSPLQNRTITVDSTTATNQNTGGGGAHNNLQPYIVVNYIIKT
jgi:microcystin-dependent protein